MEEKKCCCCCGGSLEECGAESGTGPPWVSGYVDTPAGKVPVISSELSLHDLIGAVCMRLSLGRDRYRVDPGLYALGAPGDSSPVLVTANYKMTFDVLRKSLKDRNVWLLVLDTKGINVWCAAGKGTFGTEELIRRISETGLDKVVSHRSLVLPQLGAPGVAAHVVRKETGFKVNYGPIRAGDIPRYLNNGMKVSAEMRKVTFTMSERLVLIPVELMASLKLTLAALAVTLVLGGLSLKGFSVEKALSIGVYGFILYIAGLVCGAVFVPALLPYIPGRAFSHKGFIAGVAVAWLLAAIAGKGMLASLSSLLIISSVSSFFAMNFTGATPFTSLSGVKREMAIAVPVQITVMIIGAVLWKVAGSAQEGL